MKKGFRFGAFLFMLLFIATLYTTAVYADNSGDENAFYFNYVRNAGKDTGYSEDNNITADDPHFGWSLGNFVVSGYTRVIENELVFLKNVGDTVTLSFVLNQDIDKLNGNEKLSINDDDNGYDEYFGINKTDFGRGTLIIQKFDYQNASDGPEIYTDYLAAVELGAATEIQLCEEGDYEVALDYEIRKDNISILGKSILPTYNNYCIYFYFSVRNGNCMVYPIDVATKAELTNSSFTENGFYLDLANSRYLDINIKKSIRTEGAEGITEDTRFNRPAKDHEAFTDEGIYTITAKNRYTDQTTTKIIYVGTDDVLKAHVVTGLSLKDIEYQLSLGATISADGSLIPASTQVSSMTKLPVNALDAETDSTNNTPLLPFAAGGAVVVGGGIAAVIAARKKKNNAGQNK